MKLRKLGLQASSGSHRELGRDQYQRPGRKVSKRPAQQGQHTFHIRLIAIVDGRVAGKPEQIGSGASPLWITGKRKFA